MLYTKILVVDDDHNICEMLRLYFENEGYEVKTANDGAEGVAAFKTFEPDLVLLDIMLPELNGLEVLRRIRAVSTVPVILETARGETIDKINGLNLGADDYIPKPFEIEELLARINALFRRVNYSTPQTPASSVKDLTLNLDRMSFTIKNAEVQLSKTEFLLLKLLIENQSKGFSRLQIIDEIWGKNHFIDENTVDVYVGYLRSKISEHTKDEYIRTVRGAGYTME